MANFFWVPYYDKTWDDYLGVGDGVNGNAKLLPSSNGGYFRNTMVKGDWKDLANGDNLQIGAHGRKYTTRNVSWECAAGQITWTPEEMAKVLEGFVGEKKIHHELLACFGANGLGLADSFGELLWREMCKRNMHGTLSALRGATNIGAGQGRQTGTGRVTTGVQLALSGGHSDLNGPLKKDARVTWDLLP